jgi:GNAT superfamily N-acetyltransferase
MTVIAVRHSDRPELWDRLGDATAQVWPEYNRHGDVLNEHWGRLYDDFAPFQFVLYDEERDEVLAEGHTIPLPWDGSPAGLGPGIDHAIQAGFALLRPGGRPAALLALAAEVLPGSRERGLSRVLLEEMRRLAADAGLAHVVAPVRPSWKERYPLTPIERYARWVRPDGEAFDPWIRVHLRLGGSIVAPAPRSMRITGTVTEWESWTDMAYPETGNYVFPHGLTTLHVDRDADLGAYWEPNVWIVHGTGP